MIHHEFAGLANAEKNIGASSDYFLSDQITKSLTQTVTLKLAVKKSNTASLCINKRIEVIPTALLYLQSFYPEEGYDLYKSYRCLNGYNDQNGNFVIKNITDQINNKNAAAIKAANDTRLYPNTGNGVNLSEFGGDVTLYATVLYADELSEMCQGFGYKKGFIKYTLNKVFKQLDTIEDFNFIKDKFKNKSEIWYEHETRKGNKYYDSESVLVQVTEAKCLR